MKVTVTEAMRIKNEVSMAIGNLQRYVGAINYGTMVDGGKEVVNTNASIVDYMKELQRKLIISLEVNDKLSRFNVESGISSLVRQKANNELLIKTYEQVLSMLNRQPVSRRYEVVGNNRIEIETLFTPFVSKKEVKECMKALRSDIREIQKSIEIRNAEFVDLNFEYSDIENSVLDQG